MTTRSTLFSAAALTLALAGAQAAKADGFISTVPTVHVAVAGVESQAQLAQTLRGEGYADIVLSSAAPSLANPRPELNPELVSNPQNTPVRSGWNGVAVKDGKTVQVYADLQG